MRKKKPSRKVVHRDYGEVTITANARMPIIGGEITTMRNHFVLREWWFEIQRRFHDYSCYGIFLILPSDKEVSRYLNEFGVELDTISRNNCLIIFLGDGNFQRPDINSKEWQATIRKHITLGGSVKIAQLFEIEYAKFPCLVLFEDIRSDKHIMVHLKDMSAEEVAEKLRIIFSVIQRSIPDKQNPLIALDKYRNNEKLQQTGKSIVTEVRGFAGKTMETVMEAIVKATIK
jgi:hypothetical protein